jgi:hypothetical protein
LKVGGVAGEHEGGRGGEAGGEVDAFVAGELT